MLTQLLGQGGEYILIGVEYADINDSRRYWSYDWVVVQATPEGVALGDWYLGEVFARSAGFGVRLVVRVTNHPDTALYPGETGVVHCLNSLSELPQLFASHPAHT